mmetsp:Transcript_36687/g.91378  ORF Transcript_36687/g.91378 Transcript_36687/m.91378 type:complete len:514 (-) Transcript_36687:369-1910(-)|eukprot:CAMPEP_0181360180 /NCGR_PEP_ID=MMETSP1106-20121128/6516_1 /TAXON_ID=81844 /ORGANISM="Mantoniella antarctica, Strain SL-175" /LENGTH=513 /DNA_ID=CAMNT_0023473411 /DNA_START=130 /DNA_END=1671 /DNA_ORIENTATION=+
MAPASASGRATRSSYRTVSKSSNVDESLFGNQKPSAVRGASSQVEKIPDRSAAGRRGAAGGTSDPSEHYTVLSAAEVARMRKPASILTTEEISAIKRERMAAKEAEQATSQARKETMMALEEDRKRKVKPSETELLKINGEEATKTRAQVMLEEQLDEVKNMNQMILYSKCVTIRDAQLEEKKHIKAEAQEEERRMDLMMEVERMKALDAYEEREKQRATDRKHGAAVLMNQIEERAKEREHQEELRDQDRRQMLAEIQRIKDEEASEVQRKRVAGKKLLEEVAKANLEQIDRKKLIIQSERDEEERIAHYIYEKDAREQGELSEKERVAREKELETARLRAQQEKAADHAAELDELRAMRIQEAYEREYREKERGAAGRQAAINADLSEARDRQKLLKMKQLSDQARMEQEEFFRIIDAQQQKEEEDVQHAMQTMEIRKHHKEELQSQIASNDERRDRERREYLEEGDRLRAKLRAEKTKLETIKQRKLDQLGSNGIPTKYRAELARKKINV